MPLSLPLSARRLGGAAAAGCLVVLLVVGGAAATGVRVVEVTSGSMSPTHPTGSHLVTVPLAGLPSRGDVVVLEPPFAWAEAYDGWHAAAAPGMGDLVVKRVLGLPGDRLECCAPDGSLVRNGERLVEDYLLVPPGEANNRTFRVTVPQGRVWVLGDDRVGSFDSRAAQSLTGDGGVPLEAITARVVHGW